MKAPISATSRRRTPGNGRGIREFDQVHAVFGCLILREGVPAQSTARHTTNATQVGASQRSTEIMAHVIAATAHVKMPRQAVRARVLRLPLLADNLEVVAAANVPNSRSSAPCRRGTATDGWFSACPLARMISPFRVAVPNRTPKPFAHRSTVNTAAVEAARDKGQPKILGRELYPSPIVIPPEINTTSARNRSSPSTMNQGLAFARALIATLTFECLL